jgi:YggT family protein
MAVSLLSLLSRAIDVYILLIIIRVLMSWVQPNPYNPAVQFISRLTDPYLDAIRRACPFLVVSGLDLSPIAAIFLLDITRRLLLGGLF